LCRTVPKNSDPLTKVETSLYKYFSYGVKFNLTSLICLCTELNSFPKDPVVELDANDADVVNNDSILSNLYFALSSLDTAEPNTVKLSYFSKSIFNSADCKLELNISVLICSDIFTSLVIKSDKFLYSVDLLSKNEPCASSKLYCGSNKKVTSSSISSSGIKSTDSSTESITSSTIETFFTESSKSGEYNFGQQVGSWTYYDTDGELILELTLDNDGLWKSYHTNGDISSQGTLDNSEFHSDWKYFREEDGSISKTEKWFFGTMIEQIFYNINGTKSYEQKFYLDGPLKTIKSFSPNGIIKFVESFDGERKYHGVIEDYDDGLLHEKHFYEHGKQNKRINYVYPEHREGWTEIVRDYKDNTETFRFINQKGEIYRVESKDCNVRSCLN